LGVSAKVLTGDHLLVAKKVCADIGLDVTYTLSGEELQHFTMDDTDKELRACFERTTLFARLNPGQKARVVGVLREMGHTVGFLGDGVNDALALREADVGISVDSGSDLAKDVADIILTEKSLSVLHYGIVQGRVTHGNTIKYIKMTASSNFGNVFSVVIAAAWLPFLPMLPIHLLLQNLFYDFSQLLIPWDNLDPEFLQTPHPWSARTIAYFMLIIGPTSSVFDLTTFAMGLYFFGWDSDVGDNAAHFHACWFIEGLLTQSLIVHMIRTEKIPFIQSRASLAMTMGTFLSCAVGIIIPNVYPFTSVFNFSPVPWQFWIYLPICIFCYMILVNIVKSIYIRVFHSWL